MITKAGTNTLGQKSSTRERWRVVDEHVIKGFSDTVTNTLSDIIELPLDTIADEEPTVDDVRAVLKVKILASELTSEEIDVITSLYPPWEEGKPVIADEMYSYKSTLYRVVQPHTTQADWTPEKTQALFTPAAPVGVIQEWVQPTGAQDAYNIGDQVSFKGVVYESKINANVWSPVAYPAGWGKV